MSIPYDIPLLARTDENAAMSRLKIVPITQSDAKMFIARHHRHNDPSITAVFCVGLEQDGELVGCAMAGRPKARMLDDGRTLEVTRVCVLEGVKNANSMIYGACARAGKALGYERILTYTLTTETGTSLKAAGWDADDEKRKNNGWANHTKRPGRTPSDTDMFGVPWSRVPLGEKIRWWRKL